MRDQGDLLATEAEKGRGISRRNMRGAGALTGAILLLSACGSNESPVLDPTATVPEADNNSSPSANETEAQNKINLPKFDDTNYFKNVLTLEQQKKIYDYNRMSAQEFSKLSLAERGIIADALYKTYIKDIEGYVLEASGKDTLNYPWDPFFVTDESTNDPPKPVYGVDYDSFPVRSLLREVRYRTSAQITMAMLMNRDAKDIASKDMAEKLIIATCSDPSSKTCQSYLQEMKALSGEDKTDQKIFYKYLPYSSYHGASNPRVSKTGIYEIMGLFAFREQCHTQDLPELYPPLEYVYQSTPVKQIDEKTTDGWFIACDYNKEGKTLDYHPSPCV